MNETYIATARDSASPANASTTSNRNASGACLLSRSWNTGFLLVAASTEVAVSQDVNVAPHGRSRHETSTPGIQGVTAVRSLAYRKH